jgi:LTXXQ motif family protein
MRKFAIAGLATLAFVASSTVYAEYRPWFSDHMRQMRLTPEDRAAFVDARIAAVHAGLKLTPDQEKLWPPVEAAVRDFAKLRIDRINAQVKAMGEGRDQQREEDPVTRLRERADNMVVSAAAMKKIADAADPLYKALDDSQKRRLAILTHHGRRGEGWRHRWMQRGMGHDGGPDGDGEGRERL